MILRKQGEALITNVTSLSSHDGPGLRTTVFFKGCSLKCRWCHNPETIRQEPELEWNRRLCIGCFTCNSRCNSRAISAQANYLIDKKQCVQCFTCVESCPSEALKVIGRSYSLEALEALIVKDEKLIKTMHGGVTFSGGEPALQSEFVAMLAQRLKSKGLHLALDTSGQAPWKNYEQLLPVIDLLLFDLKEMNPTKHAEFTGTDNRLIHENILRIAEYIRTHQLATRIWIRTPLIPQMTAFQENIAAVGLFINTYLSDCVDKWELCSFNNLCGDKYDRLGVRWELEKVSLLSESEMNELLVRAKQSASSIKQVTASGLNRK
ncbi:MAG: glycyl-radical enzyme activating protein [Tannerellaceae bacterium]